MTGHNPTLAGGGFHHVAIGVRDFDKSVRFYTEGLGFVLKVAWQARPQRACMLDTGDGNYLEIFEQPGRPEVPEKGAPAILHFALRTRDADLACQRARAAGAVVTLEPKNLDLAVTNMPGPLPVRIAFFKGPDGEVIELFQAEAT